MKKIIVLLAIVGLAFVGCNPLDDINDQIDAQENAPEGHAEYTLTADDYDTLELSYGSFNSEDDAKAMLPGFLSDLYPNWGQGSSVLVGYNLYVDAAEGVSDFTDAGTYSLANSDYPQGNLNATGFYPNEDPSDYMSDILNTQYPDATEGQVVLTQYKQYTEEPIVGISNLVDADFKTAQTLLDWTTQSVTGDEAWAGTQYGATMDGSPTFPGSNVNEDWLVSPEIDLSSQINPLFQVTQILNYSEGNDWFNILISTDYTDDVTSATWTSIDVSPAPAGDSWTAVTSDDYDLSGYEGETIHIAFKYESDATTGATWEIEDVLVKVPGVEGETITKDVYYTFEGGYWEASEGVYVLSADDYDSMGESSGQPGRYNNFDSSMEIDNYIQTYLSLNPPYSYGQDDDELIVIYKYYSSSAGATQTRGNLYTVVIGEWTGHQTTIATTLQFGYENGIWVPDNTIRYTLSNADYEYIGNSLESDPEYTDIVGTLINYHDYDYNWTSEQVTSSLIFFLNYLDANAEEGQKYAITYLLYDNGLNELTETFIKEGGEWIVYVL